jgi:hypothetical protein
MVIAPTYGAAPVPYMMPSGPSSQVIGPAGVAMQPVKLEEPRVFHMPQWGKLTDPQRLAFLRDVAQRAGWDPRIRERVFAILQEARVDQRQYEQQAAVLLKWVQNNVAYLNERQEIIQEPNYTLKVRAADCDDMALLLASFYEAIRLPWRFVLTGSNRLTGERVRWIEGTPYPRGTRFGHIYVTVGWPPFSPKVWKFAEPTVKGWPLGKDVVSAERSNGGNPLPELAGLISPLLAGGFGLGLNAAGVPLVASGAGMAASTVASATDGKAIFKSIALAMAVGVGVTVGSTFLIRWLEEKEIVPRRR